MKKLLCIVFLSVVHLPITCMWHEKLAISPREEFMRLRQERSLKIEIRDFKNLWARRFEKSCDLNWTYNVFSQECERFHVEIARKYPALTAQVQEAQNEITAFVQYWNVVIAIKKAALSSKNIFYSTVGKYE